MGKIHISAQYRELMSLQTSQDLSDEPHRSIMAQRLTHITAPNPIYSVGSDVFMIKPPLDMDQLWIMWINVIW